MALGYDGKLYILAFDHRGSFQKKMFGIEGDPDARRRPQTISDAKKLIYEGMEKAVERGVDASSAGVLVDEQFGCDIPELAKAHGPVAHDAGREERPGRVRLPVRRRLRRPHPSFDPDFSKVLVRYNPDGDAEMNERQPERLQAPRRLAARQRPQVPLRAARAGRGGAARVGRRRRRPLRRRAAPRADAPRDRADPGLRHRGRHLEDRGRRRARRRARCSPTRRARARAARTSRACCSGRGACDDKVDHWLREAAPVEGFIGFAIGRSIWWDALKGFLDGSARARRRRRADRRQLPALHQGLRRDAGQRCRRARRRRRSRAVHSSGRRPRRPPPRIAAGDASADRGRRPADGSAHARDRRGRLRARRRDDDSAPRAARPGRTPEDRRARELVAAIWLRA